ncbi:MAG TPA: hypothetical protein DEH22_14515 [Chloroflexi bacterium]|nr:hypothetical protein [Chloroflexota bacterium]
MIDWYNLFMNALWILACALALATLSYASWQASALGGKFREYLGQPWIQISLNVAGVLFCAGLAGTSDVLWQRVLWILLGVGFAVQMGFEFYRQRKQG